MSKRSQNGEAIPEGSGIQILLDEQVRSAPEPLRSYIRELERQTDVAWANCSVHNRKRAVTGTLALFRRPISVSQLCTSIPAIRYPISASWPEQSACQK